MLSTISSYFIPTTIPNPLELAMRKNDFSKMDTLLGAGANPAETTPDGFTVIDHAIFADKVSKLPQLITGKSSDEVVKPVLSAEILRYSLTFAARSFRNSISNLDCGKLDDKDSQESKTLDASLKKILDSKSSEKYGFQPIHLLAMSAKPDLLRFALAKNPELINLKDANGNSPLHYAAFNKDQEAFVELVKAGADIFAANTKSETPLGNLVAIVQTRDPLKLDLFDAYIFSFNLLRVLIYAGGALGYIDKSPEALVYTQTALAICNAMWSMGTFYKTLLNLWTNPKQTIPIIAIFGLGLGLLPTESKAIYYGSLKLLLNASVIAIFTVDAFKSIKLAYKNATERPVGSLLTVGVKLFNISNAYYDLYKAVSSLNYIYKTERLSQENSPTGDWCKGYKGISNISNLTPAERVRQIGSPKQVARSGEAPSECLEKAKDIIRVYNICTKDFNKLCRNLGMQLHPDKNNATDAESLFIHFNDAKEILMKMRKLTCGRSSPQAKTPTLPQPELFLTKA